MANGSGSGSARQGREELSRLPQAAPDKGYLTTVKVRSSLAILGGIFGLVPWLVFVTIKQQGFQRFLPMAFLANWCIVVGNYRDERENQAKTVLLLCLENIGG